MSKFHLAFKVKDIESTYQFYHEILKCELGRRTDHWIDFNFFGHQLSAHVSKDIPPLDFCGSVDNLAVPIPHFGCIICNQDFTRIQSSLIQNGIQFIIEPQLRYKGEMSEQKTMFVLDFSNNPIEFKSFKDDKSIFNKT